MKETIPPGEILLEEYLKPMGISQNAMAPRHWCLSEGN